MNERPLIRKMREDFRYFGGMSVIYGVIFAFCLYRNISGITFPICVAVTIRFTIQFMKRIGIKELKSAAPYLAGMVLLSISSVLTASWFFLFFNIVGIILLYVVFMMHEFYLNKDWNLPGYIKRLCILIGTTVLHIPLFYMHAASKAATKKEKRNYTILAVGIGFLAALVVLCIVLPLLLKSDVMFAKLFGRILRHINFVTIIGVGVTFLAGMTLCYAFFSSICEYNLPQNKIRTLKYYDPLIGITFSGVIGVIYVLYSTIQILYLFVKVQYGLPNHMTYAKYARGGFWELLFVSFINLAILVVCMYLFSENQILKILLTVISGCTYIMIVSAAYRMLLYISVYHLTFYRILVLWFLTLLACIMAGVIISIYRKSFPLFRYIMCVTGVLYLVFSFAPVDAYIVRYNVAHTDHLKAEDVEYFIDELAIDAAPEIAKIDLSKVELKGEYYDREDLQNAVNRYFYEIVKDNKDIWLRKANVAKLRARKTAEEYLKLQHHLEDNWWYEEL